ncbi:hypothetical protein KAR91_61970 [Candidatus Pacearchaeota archaeon]|nr:hypothetical protein [Candidatus Pacearchaeota archaeon]
MLRQAIGAMVATAIVISFFALFAVIDRMHTREGCPAMTWHDDDYGDHLLEVGLGPDGSDGYREYNGLSVDLVLRILTVYDEISDERQREYGELRRKICGLDNILENEELIEEWVDAIWAKYR